MTAADYRRALETGESTPLTGSPAASPWEPELAALLAEHGRAVMEERLIAVLLTDLALAGDEVPFSMPSPSVRRRFSTPGRSPVR